MIYLGSPYAHPDPKIREQRFRAVASATAAFLIRGVQVYSPIVFSHPLLAFAYFPYDAAYWEKHNFEMLCACGGLWVLKIEGWHESLGLRDEIAFARLRGIPVSYVDHPVGLGTWKGGAT